MPNLREDHRQLYERVRLKAIVFTFLGIGLTFLPEQAGVTQRNAADYIQVSFDVVGIVYLLLACLLFIGIFRSRHTYVFVRRVLTIAAIYNVLWVLLFILLLYKRPNQGIAWGLVMYTYFTYNTWLVRNDPGWKGIAITKAYKRDGNLDAVLE